MDRCEFFKRSFRNGQLHNQLFLLDSTRGAVGPQLYQSNGNSFTDTKFIFFFCGESSFWEVFEGKFYPLTERDKLVSERGISCIGFECWTLFALLPGRGIVPLYLCKSDLEIMLLCVAPLEV